MKPEIQIPIQSIFEPTLNIFKNALLFNYKKVGTRYFKEVVSYPNGIRDSSLQIDLQFKTHCHFTPLDYSTKLNYLYKTYDIITPFDLNTHYQYDNQNEISTFKEFNSTKTFLEFNEVENYNELFFENKNKDIVFLIRNPFERLLTGTVQILYTILNDLPNDEKTRNELKFYTNLSDSDIKNVFRYTNVNDSEWKSNLNFDALHKIFNYIMEKRWDLILQDIHTESYLSNYVDMIYNIKDKSKIKIIDLKDCRSKSSLDFFCKLRGDDLLKDVWENWDRKRDSNKLLYNTFLEYYKNIDLNSENPTVFYFIKQEYQIYKNLIESKYFVNLKD